MQKGNHRIENETVLEIRYRPNAKLLDHRGRWAESIADHMRMEHWQIVENRVDIFDADKSHIIFFGFKNGGMMLTNIPNTEYFCNYVRNVLGFVMEFENFGNPLHVERIGVRIKFCTSFGGSFEQLLNRYATRYINLTDRAQSAIGDEAKLVDLGAPLNFKDRLGQFKTICGPMKQDQFSQFFGAAGEFPSVGLFYDIDYSVRPQKLCSSDMIIDTASNFFISGWERHTRITDLLLKG